MPQSNTIYIYIYILYNTQLGTLRRNRIRTESIFVKTIATNSFAVIGITKQRRHNDCLFSGAHK